MAYWDPVGHISGRSGSQIAGMAVNWRTSPLNPPEFPRDPHDPPGTLWCVSVYVCVWEGVSLVKRQTFF